MLFDKPLPKKIITCEILYHADDTCPFVKDFKKQAKPLTIYAFLYRLFEGNNLMDQYRQILWFKEMSERASIFLDEDLVGPADKYISKVDGLIVETDEAQSQGYKSLEIFEDKAEQYLKKEWTNIDESNKLID